MRSSTRASCAVLVVVATLTAVAGSVCACSCVGLTEAEALRNSAAVFVGTLREVRDPTLILSSGDPSRFVFDVEAVYKGDVHEVQSVVSSSDGYDECCAEGDAVVVHGVIVRIRLIRHIRGNPPPTFRQLRR